MRIWIDGDACPRLIKEFLFKACTRLQLPCTLVANRPVQLPRGPLFAAVVVDGAIDAADAHIVEHCAADDLVVTADIPLASALVNKGVVAIDHRGGTFTADNVQEALATRDLMQELREGGLAQGGPPPLAAADKVRFANAFDREVTRLRRKAR